MPYGYGPEGRVLSRRREHAVKVGHAAYLAPSFATQGFWGTTTLRATAGIARLAANLLRQVWTRRRKVRNPALNRHPDPIHKVPCSDKQTLQIRFSECEV